MWNFLMKFLIYFLSQEIFLCPQCDDDHGWFVEEIIAHKWEGDKNLSLQVRWTLGDITWEPYNICKDLEALDRYLEL